jgi:hypothetical protein
LEFCEGPGVVEGEDGAAFVSVLLFSEAGDVIDVEVGPLLVSALLDMSGAGEACPAPGADAVVDGAFVELSGAGGGVGETAVEFVFVVESVDEVESLLLPQPVTARERATEVTESRKRRDIVFIEI